MHCIFFVIISYDSQLVILDTYYTSSSNEGFEIKVPMLVEEVLEVQTINSADEITDLCQIDPSAKKDHYGFWDE